MLCVDAGLVILADSDGYVMDGITALWIGLHISNSI